MQASTEPGVLRFGLFELDFRTHELRKNGRAIKIQEQPFQALHALLERPGKLVTREELRQRIWPSDTFVDFDIGLNAAVRRLRQALGDDADTPRFIQTIPRQGYRFIAPVSVVDGDASGAATEREPDATASAATASGDRPRSRRRYSLVLPATAALLLISLVVQTLVDRRKSSANPGGASTPDPEVRKAYLIGLYEGNIWTREDLNQSVGYFKAALAKDPTYAPAWAGLSVSDGLLADLGFSPRDTAMSDAKAAAIKAVELGPTLAESHAAMAGVLLHSWSWTEAEGELRRALALDPNDAMAHQWYGYYLISQSRFEQAIGEMQRALALDPLSANKQNSLAAAYYYAHRYDEALAIWRKTTAVGGNTDRRHRRMAFIYEQKRLPAEAIAELLGLLRSSGQNVTAANLERVYLTRGLGPARKMFFAGELAAAQRNESGPAGRELWIAQDCAELGDRDCALAWLDKAVEDHVTGVAYLAAEPEFDGLHSDPRFVALLRTVGLPSN